MVNEKEALYCREALEALGFKVFYSGGGHYHHAKDYGEFHVLLNGLNDIDDCGELVTDRKSMIAATFDHESDCTSLMFHNLADAVSFFTDYEINQRDKVGEAKALMEKHNFFYTSTGGGCDSYADKIDRYNVLFLVTNTAGLHTFPQSIDESVALILEHDCEQIAYWNFDDLTSALAFADIFVSKKGD
jgi:hypothetical protein